MAHLLDLPLHRLQFYATASYACSYLPQQEARSQVVTPGYLVDQVLYSHLVENGFRRSGSFTYRPHCDRCSACVPVRIDVNQFRPSRSQRRAWNRHSQLSAVQRPLHFNPEHFELYARYQSARHLEGETAGDSQDQYEHFLLQSSVTSYLVEFRDHGVLRMVSVIDELVQGLSSVYTFYEPHQDRSSYGTYNILWQVQRCKDLGLPWLYLGYWIAGSRKMAYKIHYQPLQGLINQQWAPLPCPA